LADKELSRTKVQMAKEGNTSLLPLFWAAVKEEKWLETRSTSLLKDASWLKPLLNACPAALAE
jgi:hypothetical protein